MTNTTLRKRAGAAAAIIAMVGAGLIGSAGAAQAATPGNIDFDADTSLTVHKHENSNAVPQSPGANPEGVGTIDGAVVGGVTFTAYSILDGGGAPVDLSVPSNWDCFEGLTVAAGPPLALSHTGVPASCAATTATWQIAATAAGSGLTDNTSGQAVIQDGAGADLPIGAYVVAETDAPPTVVQRAEPFIVTLPTPYGNGWVYDVHVFPKNAVSDVEKAVLAPNGLGLGSVVEFPVTVRIPQLAGSAVFTSFDVVDTLDSRLGNVEVVSVEIDMDGDGTADNAVPAGHYDVVTSGNTLTVVFDTDDAAVRTYLANNAGRHIIVTFAGEVASLGATAPALPGVITNTATAFINDPDHDTDGIVSNEVNTNWGDVQIRKYAANGPDPILDASGDLVTLQGAAFQVYAASTPHPATADLCENAVASGSPISVAGQTTFPSDADGVASIDGLFVSDSDNPTMDHPFRCYVVVETAAPAGYVLDATPRGIAVYTGLTAVDLAQGLTLGGFDLEVPNQQQNVPELPLTGAQAQVLMVVVGSALVVAAVAILLVSRRRRNAVGQQ